MLCRLIFFEILVDFFVFTSTKIHGWGRMKSGELGCLENMRNPSILFKVFLNMSIQYLCKKSNSMFLLKLQSLLKLKSCSFFSSKTSCAFIANKFSFCLFSEYRIYFSIFLSLIQYVREDSVLLLHKFSEMIPGSYFWMLEEGD